MGCLLSRGIVKHDEVFPIGIRPQNIMAKPTPSCVGQPQQPEKVVVTRETATTGPLANQNGSLHLKDQNGLSGQIVAVCPSGTADLTSKKAVPVPTSENDAARLSNQNAVVSATSQNGDVNCLPSEKDTACLAKPSNENASEDAVTSPTSVIAASSSDENDAVGSIDHKRAAEEIPFQMATVSIEKVPDGDGCPITLGKLFGVWTAPWPSLPEQIMRAQLFTFHDSDVILSGYPKSGSHWLWEMLHMLMIGRPEHCRTPKERLMLSFSTQEFFNTMDPPRVFNTHAPFHGFPAALREGRNRCKMIHLFRNPKDVAVSYYNHLINQIDFDYDGNFHGYLDLFLEGKGEVLSSTWRIMVDYVLGWEETMKTQPHLPILVLHFEDVKEDTVSALQRVSEFLNLERDPELLKQIAAQCTINRMKVVDKELKEQGPEHVNLSKTGKNFILRKGEVGDWTNWFSEQDDQRFMAAVHDKLRHSHLRFRYLLGDKEEEKEEEEESTWL